MNDEDNTRMMTPGSRKGIKSAQVSNNNFSSTKKMTNVSKKIENVEYLIKIEQKNKRQLEEKYSKGLEKVESQIEKWEVSLESTLKALNDKEAKIFEIQKAQLETFKLEIAKYENVMSEIEEKANCVLQEIQEAKYDEMTLYNQSNMFLEDYLSYQHEITLIKRKVLTLRDNLKEIEKTYPKEFHFLLEDIELEKEMNEISQIKKSLNEDIEICEKNRKLLLKTKETKFSEIQSMKEEINILISLIEKEKNDNSLIKMEDYINKNINDMLQFDKLKILVQNYYSQKNFDLENELNVLLIKNLNEKLKEMKNEFVTIKNEKLFNRSKLEKTIEELIRIYSNNKNSIDNLRIENDINLRKVELERLNNEINLLELNCKKKETLFNKYIIVLRNKCRKSSQESYYEMNPSLIIETEFEEKFKEEIMKLIDSEGSLQLSKDEKIKNKNMIEIYFKELMNREKLIQGHINKKKKHEDNVEAILKELERSEEELAQCETDISNKKSQVMELTTKEKIYLEKIEIRNRKLTADLESLGEGEFEKYMKSNDGVLKNMKKIYGNKILDKVFKVQKQKFMENVIMDHSYKKGKVNEFMKFISKFESLLDNYNSNKNSIQTLYQSSNKQYETVLGLIAVKNKEKSVLLESKDDLREKIEIILQEQIQEIEREKKKLQFKFNTSYYIEKIKEASDRLTELNRNKEMLVKEYENFSNIINEKEHKLYLEDLDLKNNYISLSMGGEENMTSMPLTVMPYKVNRSYESAGKLDYNSSDADEKEEKFNEMMKRSMMELQNREEENVKVEEEGLSSSTNVNVNVGVKSEQNISDSQKNLFNDLKLDPFITLTVEKLKPLVVGLNMYKKFNNNSMVGKIFDPLQSDVNPPESCGYAIRSFKINPQELTLEIKNQKSKHIENRINLLSIKGLLLGASSKNLVKLRKTKNAKPNGEINKLVRCDFIQFMLLFQDGKMDVIAPSYQLFKALEDALEEVAKNRKNLEGVLKYVDH